MISPCRSGAPDTPLQPTPLPLQQPCRSWSQEHILDGQASYSTLSHAIPPTPKDVTDKTGPSQLLATLRGVYPQGPVRGSLRQILNGTKSRYLKVAYKILNRRKGNKDTSFHKLPFGVPGMISIPACIRDGADVERRKSSSSMSQQNQGPFSLWHCSPRS